MRTIIAILLLVPLSISLLQAQSPGLMNYQGLARDSEGTILSDRELNLHISILKDGPGGTAVFSEFHRVKTNRYGLFTLPIGGGDVRQGAIDAVDWSQGSYWLQVEMDENGGYDFTMLGATQLLSVPYALHATHAETAERLGSGASRYDASSNPSPGSPWSTVGNTGTDPALDFLGTTDITPLAFRTNNIERMRLTAYGKFGIGVAQPVSTLDVAGNTTIGLGWAGNKPAPENGLLIEGQVGIGEPFPNATLEVHGEMIVGSMFTGRHQAPMNGALFEGRVGIGTAGPGSMLSVTKGLSVGSTFADNAAPVDGAAFEGRVGIGTTIPQSMLGVNGGASIGAQYARSYTAPPNGLIVQGATGIGTEQPASKASVAGNMTIGLTYAPLFGAPENGLLVEGAVGIGVEETSYKFEVLGNSFFDGTVRISDSLNVYGPLSVYDLTDVQVITRMEDGLEDERYLASLNTHGGGAVRQNLNVGRDLGVARDVWVGRNLTVRGDGRFNNLYVDNLTTSGDTVTSDEPMTFINKGESKLYGQVFVLNATNSTSTSTGALTVDGGLGVQQNLNLGGQLHIDYSAQSAISNGQKEKFPLFLEGARQGIAIKLNGSTSNDNYFVGFWDKSQLRGAIQGETRAERMLSLEYILMTVGHAFDLTDASLELASEIADYRVGVGFGAVTVTPGPAKIAYAAAKLVALIAQTAAEQYDYIAEYGVSYSSGSGDYAEWLEREDPESILVSGDIVGVYGGKISLRTKGATHLMVVSSTPIVLGNVPEKEREQDFEKCAFLGQVPVKVVGPVSPGDYIIPNGRENGIGIGVQPSEITISQASQVVGVSWGSVAEGMPGQVIAAVGLPVQASISVVENQQKTIESLQSRVKGLEAVLRELIPDFDERLSAYGVEPVASVRTDGEPVQPAKSAPPPPSKDAPNADLLTDEIFDQAVEIARQHFTDQGRDPNDFPVMVRLSNDEAFRGRFLTALKTMISTGGDRSALERVLRESGIQNSESTR